MVLLHQLFHSIFVHTEETRAASAEELTADATQSATVSHEDRLLI